MPQVKNENINIYYEVKGAGPSVVMLHGFSSSSMHWHVSGFVEALSKTNQVILIDLRGHGKSGKPQGKNQYSMDRRLKDIDAVLNRLNVEQAHFLGYSMGGWLAFGMAVNYPERVLSLIVGGAHPYEESFRSFSGVDGSSAEAFISAFQAFIGEAIDETIKPFVLQNDLVALAAAASDRDDISALVPPSLPMFFFVGENDLRLLKVTKASQQFEGRLLVLPDAGHLSALFFGAVLTREVKNFLHPDL